MQLPSESFRTDRIPFANERQLQRFIIANFRKLFGAEVVASTLSGGTPIQKIDILAVDASDRVYLVECKWDAIGSRTVDQLLEYRDALLRNWRVLELRVANQRRARLRSIGKRPVLIAIGYRRKSSAQDTSVETLVYRYEGGPFGRFVDLQTAGSVRLYKAADVDDGVDASHPEVLKTDYAKARTGKLPSTVHGAFWRIDGSLRRLQAVRPKYRGKRSNPLATYRRDGKVFASAILKQDAIEWEFPQSLAEVRSIKLRGDSDPAKILAVLRRAYKAV